MRDTDASACDNMITEREMYKDLYLKRRINHETG